MTEDNGCLWVLPGSHRLGPRPHVPAGQILRAEVPPDAEATAIPVLLDPGDVATFSSLTLHRSGPNRTTGTRPAWLLQFRDAGARRVPES